MAQLPVPLCEPCRRRNRQARADRKVGDEWWCSPCFFGQGGEERKCLLCPRSLRETTRSDYCFACQQSGAARRDMKRKEENGEQERLRQDPAVGQESGGYAVPRNFGE